MFKLKLQFLVCSHKRRTRLSTRLRPHLRCFVGSEMKATAILSLAASKLMALCFAIVFFLFIFFCLCTVIHDFFKISKFDNKIICIIFLNWYIRKTPAKLFIVSYTLMPLLFKEYISIQQKDQNLISSFNGKLKIFRASRAIDKHSFLCLAIPKLCTFFILLFL